MSNLLLLLFVILVLFGITIFWGLRSRKSLTAENLDLCAKQVWESVASSGWDFSSMLYGVRQDFSNTETRMIVHNSRDEQVARITFHMAARDGWVTIQMEDATFEADVLPTFLRSVALHPAFNKSEIVCTFRRRLSGTYCFTAQGLGVLEGKPGRRFGTAPLFEYTLDGRPIGISRHIGGAVNRGNLLVLPADIPLQIRTFVLALQASRF